MVTGGKLLSSYLKSKSQSIQQAASNPRQRAATQQAELRRTRQHAQEARAEAERLAQERAAIQQAVVARTSELDLIREQAAQGAAVDDAALAALEADVSDLTFDLSEMNDEWVYVQEEADLAEDAYLYQEDLFAGTGTPEEWLKEDAPFIDDVPPLDMDSIDPWFDETPSADEIAAETELEEAVAEEKGEPTFLDQYKWHLAIGGAAAAIGAWFYFAKYKPAQEATAATPALEKNYDDDYGFDGYDDDDDDNFYWRMRERRRLRDRRSF